MSAMQAPIRLLKIVPTLLCGGTENQAITLARSLHEQGFSLEVACLRRLGPFVKEINDRGIPLLEYPIPGFYSFTALVQKAKLARHLVRRRVDVMHSYSFYGNVFGILPAKLASTPVVIASIRDRGAYLTPMQKKVQRFVCRFADCVLVNAEAVKDWLESEGYEPSKIVVIPNGVEMDRFSDPPQPDRIRDEMRIPRGAPMVMVISRLTPQKGIEHFLEAAAILAPRFPDARFVVVGYANPAEQDYESTLKAMADRLGISGSSRVHRAQTGCPGTPGCRDGVGDAVAQRGAVERGPRIDGGRGSYRGDPRWRHTGSDRRRRDGVPRRARRFHRAGGVDRHAAGGSGARLAGSDERRARPSRIATRQRRWSAPPRSCIWICSRANSESHLPDLLMYSVDLVSDSATFVGLKNEWNDAVERAAIPHPFLRHEWTRSVVGCVWRQAASCTSSSSGADGRVVAIAPLMFERAHDVWRAGSPSASAAQRSHAARRCHRRGALRGCVSRHLARDSGEPAALGCSATEPADRPNPGAVRFSRGSRRLTVR